MALVKKDKRKDFTVIFDKNYESLCLYAVKFTRDFVEAEDIVQSAFMRFWEMYQKNTDKSDARPLLYRITRNMCIDYIRNRQVDTVDAETVADQLAYYFQPESKDDSRIDLLMEAVKNLPDRCQQVLIAVCFNGKKYKEVAEQMQISVNTIKTQLSRALKLLSDSLNKEDFDLFLTILKFSY